MAIVLCLCSMGALAGCTKTRSINVLVYGQYIDLDVISNFKKENGIKVNVDECDTPEELYNKAVNGDQSYDLICTSDYIIERFIKENRLSELNFDNIPNIKNIGEVYLEKSKSFDPENKSRISGAQSVLSITPRWSPKRMRRAGRCSSTRSIPER